MKKLILLLLLLSLSACSLIPGKNQPAPLDSVETTAAPEQVDLSVTATPEVVETEPVVSEDEATATPEDEPTPLPEDGLQACIERAKHLNVRIGPGRDQLRIGYLHTGDCVVLLERDKKTEWVRYEGGWISIDYLDLELSELQTLPVYQP